MLKYLKDLSKGGDTVTIDVRYMDGDYIEDVVLMKVDAAGIICHTVERRGPATVFCIPFTSIKNVRVIN